MFYQKSGGVWTYQDGRPYVRRPGTGWTPIQEGYVKRAGLWTKFFTYDPTPPVAPNITLTEEITTFGSGGSIQRGRHINVAVQPGAVDTTVRRIRLLVSTQGQPISQYDTSGYIAGSPTGSTEPWSELYYNSYNGATRVTSSLTNRDWTRNATDQTVVPQGTYYFSAWAEDFQGNWSPGRFKSITLGSFSTALPSWTVRISANGSGSWQGPMDGPGGEFVGGDLQQSGGTTGIQSRGVFFYVNQIAAQLRKATNPEITSAQIFIHRRNDTGNENCNVYLCWHEYPVRGDIGNNITLVGNTKVGTMAKGESKWFDIPENHWDDIEAGRLIGFGLFNRAPDGDPDTSAQNKDYSVMKAVSETPRNGELYITFRDRDG